jgi:hypothetical protein
MGVGVGLEFRDPSAYAAAVLAGTDHAFCASFQRARENAPGIARRSSVHKERIGPRGLSSFSLDRDQVRSFMTSTTPPGGSRFLANLMSALQILRSSVGQTGPSAR